MNHIEQMALSEAQSGANDARKGRPRASEGYWYNVGYLVATGIHPERALEEAKEYTNPNSLHLTDPRVYNQSN